ncbi:hypothetical protein GCM10029964_089170 [Kibdelosporangium lantanae]
MERVAFLVEFVCLAAFVGSLGRHALSQWESHQPGVTDIHRLRQLATWRKVLSRIVTVSAMLIAGALVSAVSESFLENSPLWSVSARVLQTVVPMYLFMVLVFPPYGIVFQLFGMTEQPTPLRAPSHRSRPGVATVV